MIYIASDNQEQKKMRVFLRVYPIVFFLIVCSGAHISAQDLNPTVVDAKILQGESFTFDFISNKPISIVAEENAEGGAATTEEITVNLDYRFSYQSAPDFVGESRFVIERSSIIGSYKVYTEINVKVVPSLLEAMKDVVFLPVGSSEITIDVLANDIAGNGPSSVIDVELVSNGNATISGNQIIFTKANGFEGTTSFNYTVEDASGFKSSGIVIVNVGGATTLAGTTLNFLTSNSSPIDIILDDASYELNAEDLLSHGDLIRVGDFHYLYTPDLTALGRESFRLNNGSGGQVQVFIDIIDDGGSTVLVRDDVFYTSVNTPIQFDPRENDYSQDGVLIDYSEELNFNGSTFSYTPQNGYSGVKEFFYTILDGQKEIDGAIEIYIGNYLPQLEDYEFETFESTPFVIEYAAPINNYQWNLVSSPRNGEMSMNVGSYISPSCNVISGDRMVIYVPDNGFTGTDNFKIEYCVDNGACKTVNVSINVVPTTENCACFGGDCVWAGDADNDGKVSVKDILAIGYNYGEIGTPRSTSSVEWGGLHAEDWPFQQDESSVNNKFADSNGDGIISSEDATVLNEHLNAYHNINAQEVVAEKNLPLVFIPRNGELQLGLNILDVYLGSSSIPAEDLRGVAFSTQFSLSVVDENSIKFFPSEEWIGNGSPIISAIDVTNGLLSVGIARTSETGIYGDGRIGETRIILESLDGTRPGGDIDVDIIFENAIVKNSTGKSYKIDAQAAKFKLKLDDLSKDAVDVVLYPNPSSTLINFYANNNDELIEIRLFDMVGSMIAEYPDIQNRELQIDHQLPQGVYTASIKTQRGLSVQRFQVINLH